MDNTHTGELEGTFVEFVFRVHADGKRERFAATYVTDPNGAVRRASDRPEGALARFVAEAVAEATGARRVSVDDRTRPSAAAGEGRMRARR